MMGLESVSASEDNVIGDPNSLTRAAIGLDLHADLMFLKGYACTMQNRPRFCERLPDSCRSNINTGISLHSVSL